MRGALGGSRGLVAFLVFGSVCCIGIPVLIPVIASIGLGGVLLAAGVGVPLSAVVVVAGIVGARWYRSRPRPLGPGLPIAAQDTEGGAQAGSSTIQQANRASASSVQGPDELL